MAIKLENYNKDVILKTVQIQDFDNNVIKTMPLQLINEDDQFYVTESLLPPNKSFKLAVRFSFLTIILLYSSFQINIIKF